MAKGIYARSPKSAARDAAYLYNYAIRIEGADRAIQELGKGMAVGTVAAADAVDRLAPMLVKEETAGLRAAFVEAGQHEYAAALDDGRLEELREALVASRETAWVRTLDDLLEGCEGLAYRLLAEAEWTSHRPSFIADQEVRLRPDAAPEIVRALRLDPDAPLDLVTLTNLLGGRAADGQAIEGRQPHPRAVAWLDLTLSASKSVSLLHAFAPSRDAAVAIERAHKDAVDEALRAVADGLGRIRVGPDRSRGYQPGAIVWVQAMHTISRLGDPDLHSHVAILNVTAGADGRVRAMDTMALHGKVESVLSRAYHEALGRALHGMGYAVGIEQENRRAHALGVPEPVERAFSQSQARVKAMAASYVAAVGLTLNDWQMDALKHSVRTRFRATQEVGDPEAWEERAADLGWDPAGLYSGWEERAVAEAETPEWQRMATARGWVWVPPTSRSAVAAAGSLRSSEDRRFSVRFPDGGFHRGGTEVEWGLGVPTSRAAERGAWDRSR